MTLTTWTSSRDGILTVGGIDLSRALRSYSIRGSYSNAMASGPVVLTERAATSLFGGDIDEGDEVKIVRNYTYYDSPESEGEPVIYPVFDGLVRNVDRDRGMITLTVDDMLARTMRIEVNKIYGTADVPVKLSEIIWDVVTMAGLSCVYGQESGNTIQESSLETEGWTAVHQNGYTFLQDVIKQLDWQIYYNPYDKRVYAEPKGYQDSSPVTLTTGDNVAGLPKWSVDGSQMCNHLTVTPMSEVQSGGITEVLLEDVDCSEDAVHYIALPTGFSAISSVLYTQGTAYGGHSAAYQTFSAGRIPEFSSEEDMLTSWEANKDFCYAVLTIGTTVQLAVLTNPNLDYDPKADLIAGDKVEVTHLWEGASMAVAADVDSISSYGIHPRSESRTDLGYDDATTYATSKVAALGWPLQTCVANYVQSPLPFVYLGQTADMHDNTVQSKTVEGMIIVGFELQYPKGYDVLTLGEMRALFSDYAVGLDRRIRTLEANVASRDYSQVQYVPLEAPPDPEEPPGATWTITTKVSTVASSGTTTANALGNSMMWKTGYAGGRHWMFWGDAANNVFSSSVDGESSWASPTTLATGTGNDLSIDFGSTGLHYVRGWDTGTLHYRRGTCNSNGTMSWTADEDDAEAGGSVNRIQHFTFDTNLNLVYVYKRDNAVYVNRMLKPGGGYDGTWVSDTSGGFPMLVASADANLRASVCRLSGSKFFVFYGSAGSTLKGKLFNGTSLGSEETCTQDVLAGATYLTHAHDNSDELWLCYNGHDADYRLMYTHRDSEGNWDASEQDVVGSAVASSSVGFLALGSDANLYCVWMNYPTTGHIYYRPIEKDGTMGDIEDAYTETDGFASLCQAHIMPVARDISSSPLIGVLDFAYLSGSSPYKVKNFKMTFSYTSGTPPEEEEEEEEPEGVSPIGENYDYICYPDGRAGPKGGSIADRGSALQGIQWAIDNCPVGDNILLAPGTFTINGMFYPKNNNIFGSVVYEDDVSVWNGTTLSFDEEDDYAVPATKIVSTLDSSSAYIMRRENYNGEITIAYLELDGGLNSDANNSRQLFGGIGIYRCTNTTVAHCYIHNFTHQGIYVANNTYPSDYSAIIVDNEISYCGLRYNSTYRVYGCGVALGSGGYSVGASKCHIYNNFIHHISKHAVNCEPSKFSIIEDNFLHCPYTFDSAEGWPWCTGMKPWGSVPATGNTFDHNFIHTLYGWGVVFNKSSTTGNVVTNNEIYYSPSWSCFAATEGASTGAQTISGNNCYVATTGNDMI